MCLWVDKQQLQLQSLSNVCMTMYRYVQKTSAWNRFVNRHVARRRVAPEEERSRVSVCSLNSINDWCVASSCPAFNDVNIMIFTVHTYSVYRMKNDKTKRSCSWNSELKSIYILPYIFFICSHFTSNKKNVQNVHCIPYLLWKFSVLLYRI